MAVNINKVLWEARSYLLGSSCDLPRTALQGKMLDNVAKTLEFHMSSKTMVYL